MSNLVFASSSNKIKNRAVSYIFKEKRRDEGGHICFVDMNVGD